MFRKLFTLVTAGAVMTNNHLVNGAKTETDASGKDIDCCIPYPTYAIINDKMDNHISLTVQPMDEKDCDKFHYATRDNSKTGRGSSPFTMLFDDAGVNQCPVDTNCAREFSEDEIVKIAADEKDCRLTKNSIENGKGFTTLNREKPWEDKKSRLALTIGISDPRPKPLCDNSFLGGAKSAVNFFYHFLTPKEDAPSQQNNQQTGMSLGG